MAAGRAHHTRTERRAGFILLEAVVGLALIAMVATAAFVAFAQAGERSARAGERLRAVLAADAILARVGLDLPLRPHRTAGTLSDGAAWVLEVRAFAGADEGPEALPLQELYTLLVTVTPRNGAPVSLSTLRLREPRP
jgi:type II secretory pathway pseudopilin PulG